MKMIVGVFFSV